MKKLLFLALLITAPAFAQPANVRVIDGDTIAVGEERIRLLGIDAPELPGHCRRGRDCAPGDGQASKANLERLLADGELKITRAMVHNRQTNISTVSLDLYGRTLANVSVNSGDLSCAQLSGGFAIYRPDWDKAHSVRDLCPQ